MNNFVDAFGNSLSRMQIKYLISKLEKEQLITKGGLGRHTRYSVDLSIDTNKTIIPPTGIFLFHMELSQNAKPQSKKRISKENCR
jgi:hypothetical protein